MQGNIRQGGAAAIPDSLGHPRDVSPTASHSVPPAEGSRHVDATSAARWVDQFGSAPLSPVHAVALANAAHGITEAAAVAARALDWLTPDAFNVTLRQQEISDANPAR
ncbi:hypothetical protein [Pandoraea cepalis]|uniref:Uncharacterized protein n=1 Tax=Pandoraea cepalis TaxID=2508294 RepID=A0A5E4XNX0_9BURK|nr:hypothetical protein [Pandoraea cepalis]VVE38077.1 hypothetical protein PCE31107_04007 [Pandoraea cepalis]